MLSYSPNESSQFMQAVKKIREKQMKEYDPEYEPPVKTKQMTRSELAQKRVSFDVSNFK
jgi:hypothetical protein